MKYRGHYEFAGHAMPGQPITTLHYEGRDQKKILTEAQIKELLDPVKLTGLDATKYPPTKPAGK
jgi:hypothetical protein